MPTSSKEAKLASTIDLRAAFCENNMQVLYHILKKKQRTEHRQFSFNQA